MDNSRLLSLLSLCRKAGRLVTGFDAVKQAVLTGKASLVLCSTDISEKTRASLSLICEEFSVTVLPAPVSINEIWYAVSKKAGIVAVCDEGLSLLVKGSLPRSSEEDNE